MSSSITKKSLKLATKNLNTLWQSDELASKIALSFPILHWWLNCQERLRSRKNRDRHTKQRIDRITRATPWGILWSWSDAMRRRMTNLVNKEQWDSWMKVWVSYFWHHVIGRQQSRLLLKFITQSNIVESHGRSTIKQRIMGETHYIKAWWETKGWFSSEWFVEKKTWNQGSMERSHFWQLQPR